MTEAARAKRLTAHHLVSFGDAPDLQDRRFDREIIVEDQ